MDAIQWCPGLACRFLDLPSLWTGAGVVVADTLELGLQRVLVVTELSALRGGLQVLLLTRHLLYA